MQSRGWSLQQQIPVRDRSTTQAAFTDHCHKDCSSMLLRSLPPVLYMFTRSGFDEAVSPPACSEWHPAHPIRAVSILLRATACVLPLSTVYCRASRSVLGPNHLPCLLCPMQTARKRLAGRRRHRVVALVPAHLAIDVCGHEDRVVEVLEPWEHMQLSVQSERDRTASALARRGVCTRIGRVRASAGQGSRGGKKREGVGEGGGGVDRASSGPPSSGDQSGRAESASSAASTRRNRPTGARGPPSHPGSGPCSRAGFLGRCAGSKGI